MDPVSAAPVAGSAGIPAAPRTPASSPPSAGRSRTDVPPPAGSSPPHTPLAAPARTVPRLSSLRPLPILAEDLLMPDFCSGPAGLSGRSMRDYLSGALMIRGQKSEWVSNGTFATHAALYVSLESARSMGMAGGGVAVVSLALPGVSRGKPLDKLGQRGLNQGEIFFDNVRIPRHYMVVTPDTYEDHFRMILTSANGMMATAFTGLARAAYELALDYSMQRVQGGRPICP